jgi:hypothetical protein
LFLLRYWLTRDILNEKAENVLVVKAEATHPDGWWYDGGGIYRHVTLTVVTPTLPEGQYADSPGPYIAPDGIYVPSQVDMHTIRWVDNLPFADARIMPHIDVVNGGLENVVVDLTIAIVDRTGVPVGSTNLSTTLVPGPNHIEISPWTLPQMALWHVSSTPGTQPPFFSTKFFFGKCLYILFLFF